MGSWIVLAGGMGHARRTVARGSQVLKAALGADGAAQSAELASQRGDKDRMRGTLRPFSVRDRRTRHIRGIPFARGLGRDLKLDLVVPRTEGTNRPVLLHIHGGAWILGFKTYQGMPLMNRMAARDWVCVNIDYRLSPMATFPDHLVDVKKAIAWIRYNITDFGGDPDFICVTGGSAGGHLTALTALTANDPEYQPGFEHVDTTVAAAVPFYGIYDLTNRLGTMPDRWVSDFVAPFVMKTGLTDDPEAYAKASPLDQIHADAPPFLLVHGSIDNLAPIEDGREFRKRLDHVSRNAVAMLEVPFAHHAFDVYENGRCRAAVDTVVRFLLYQHHLYTQEGTKPRSVDARAVGLA
jgi:acetyl esterase/lipase